MARVVRNGHPRNDLIQSAHVDGNGGVFSQVLDLYVPAGSRVADVTFGRGAFWKEIPPAKYVLLASDIETGVDCRDLPHADGSVDCVVLDPPYMHSPGGTAHASGHRPMEAYYRNNRPNRTGKKYHEAVLELYADAGKEAYRVLRPRGVFVVKCQDEVCSNRQRLTHMEITQQYQDQGFVVEDLFVVVRANSPGVSRAVRQVHARKNHSYFLVFWKRCNGGVWESPMSAVDLFAELVKTRTKADKWTGSVLEKYQHLGSSTRAAIGEEFVRRYLQQFGISAKPVVSRGAEMDFLVGSIRIKVKTASEDTTGNFQFNHVRSDRNYGYLLCLGVQPSGLMFNLWSKGDVDSSKGMVGMAAGQHVTLKLTKGQDELHSIEELPEAIRAILDDAK